MPLTDAGLLHALRATLGESVTPFNQANAYLGVGNSDAAFAAGQTDLQGTAVRRPMEPSFPQRTGLVTDLRGVFGSSDANLTWAEWAWFNAAAGGTMFTRKVEALGTKASPEIWQLDASVEFEHCP